MNASFAPICTRHQIDVVRAFSVLHGEVELRLVRRVVGTCSGNAVR